MISTYTVNSTLKLENKDTNEMETKYTCSSEENAQNKLVISDGIFKSNKFE